MRRQAAEDAFVDRLVRGFTRSPGQINRPHESDAELVRLPGSELVLAVTVDQIVEEVRAGLYDDPYLLGWMTVAASASDLAAVGAAPLGVVIGHVLRPDTSDAALDALQRGIADAANAAGLPVLGGDTAFDSAASTSATAFGVVAGGAAMTRRGAAIGDRLFATGPLGSGSVFAWAKRRGETAPRFLPAPRLDAGALARGFASAAADTSDGALAACDLLLPPEGVDVVWDAPPEAYLHPDAARLAAGLGIPPWMLLAGPHGEFELLLAVPEAAAGGLVDIARSRGIRFLDLGRFAAGTGAVRFPGAGVSIDPAAVRDAQRAAPADPRAFLRALGEAARPLSARDREVTPHATR